MMKKEVEKNNIWRARVLEQGLAHLGQALLIVSSRGQVLFASEAAEILLASKSGLSLLSRKLVAELEPDNFRLQRAIQAVIEAHHPHENPIGVYIHRSQHPRPYYLAVSRLSKQDDERRDGHNALILIKDLSLNFEHWAGRLKGEFDLCPREIECVVLLTERRSVNEVSEVMGICKETVRQYIKSAFKKTGVRKQHELVSLALEYRRNR